MRFCSAALRTGTTPQRYGPGARRAYPTLRSPSAPPRRPLSRPALPEKDTMGCTITFCTFWPCPRYAMTAPDPPPPHAPAATLSTGSRSAHRKSLSRAGARRGRWDAGRLSLRGRYRKAGGPRLYCSRRARIGRTTAVPHRVNLITRPRAAGASGGIRLRLREYNMLNRIQT